MEYVNSPDCPASTPWFCRVQGTLHWGDACGKGLGHGAHGLWGQPSPDISDDFHVFSVEWSSKKIAWSVDGVEYWSQNASAVEIPQTPFHFIINTARRPEAWQGFPWPVQFEIDWVRAWAPVNPLKTDDVLAPFRKGGRSRRMITQKARCQWPMSTPRCIELLTTGWLFSNISAADSSTTATARVVTIPHDFVIEGDFAHDLGNRDHGYLPRGVGYYTRMVEAPAAGAGGTAYLHFEGAFRDTRVYIDGAQVAHHLSGYTGFTVPLAKRSQVLTVVCNATLGEGWFYEGGGIYRPVHLVQTSNPLRVLHDGVFVSPQIRGRIRCNRTVQQNRSGGECTADVAAITTQVEVVNDRSSNATFSVTVVLHAHDGAVVGSASSSVQSVERGSTTVTRVVVVVQNVSLWSIDAPHLHTMVTTLTDPAGLAVGYTKVAATAVDRVTTPFGVRKVRWSPDSGMLLNEQQVRLNGFANHQDLGGLGTAVPDPLQDYRVHRMKELGANAWRCAHNPPNPALVGAMDRLGMVVIVENRRFGPSDNYDKHHAAPPVNATQIAADVVTMVRTFRNSPSVVLWSLCNEEGCFEHLDTNLPGLSVGASVKQLIA